MSKETWNFPTFQPRDFGPGFSRATTGDGFAQGGPLPFTNSFTGVFSFCADSDYCADANELQFITSIGQPGGSKSAMAVRLNMDAAGDSKLTIAFWDNTAGIDRYYVEYGDEDGVNWLSFDKWYQVAFSATTAGLTTVINGSTTFTSTTFHNNPGSLNLDLGSDRWWHAAPDSSWNQANANFISVQWPSCTLGPSAWDNTAIDLTSQSVRNRIFDAEGNLKPPGENGSLWFNNSYTTSAGFAPKMFMTNGSPRFNMGSHTWTWIGNAASSSTANPVPGGLRKYYEL